jgi:hypothetical protein
MRKRLQPTHRLHAVIRRQQAQATACMRCQSWLPRNAESIPKRAGEVADRRKAELSHLPGRSTPEFASGMPVSPSACRAIACTTVSTSPIADACSKHALGWRSRSSSSNAGRSRRRWPPRAMNIGSTMIRSKSSASRASAQVRKSGGMNSRKASSTRTSGDLSLTAAQTRRIGSAHCGSRAPWAKRIRAVFDIRLLYRIVNCDSDPGGYRRPPGPGTPKHAAGITAHRQARQFPRHGRRDGRHPNSR